MNLTRRTAGTLSAATVGAALLAGCSSDEPADDTSQLPAAESSEVTSPGGSTPGGAGRNADLANEQFKVSWQDALRTAQAAFGGRPTSIELGWENNEYAYTVELVSDTEEFDAEISATTGQIVSQSTDRLDEEDKREAADDVIDADGVIPVGDAVKTATAEAAGRVTEWKLDGSSRGTFYEFDIDVANGDDVDVVVDARTGGVVKTDR